MAPDYKTFLAQQVLNEGQSISYRQLSREFGIHGNIAKRMLFHFQKQQNSQKPGSIHATYLISGLTAATALATSSQNGTADGEDTFMQSSPFMSSSMPQQDNEDESLAVRIVAMCREEDLEGNNFRLRQVSECGKLNVLVEIDARTYFQQLVSIHIYSLAPSTIRNLHILSDCNRLVYEHYATEDPLKVGRRYGVIQNAQVKRRTGARPVPAASPSAVGKTTHSGKPSNSAITAAPQPAKAPISKHSQQRTSSLGEAKLKDQEKQQSTRETKAAIKTPGLKREQSDIFKSFSKPKPKLSQEDAESSMDASPAPQAESPAPVSARKVEEDMPRSDDSESDPADGFLKGKEEAAKSGHPTRAEREERLRKMMDDDDDEAMGATNTKSISQAQGQPATEAGEEQSEEPPATSSTTTSGRRRGRRKVMKKKMLKDEEGYLVTKEEAAWESFSENEPPPKESTPIWGTSSFPKVKKETGKPAQGNIMAFFGKK